MQKIDSLKSFPFAYIMGKKSKHLAYILLTFYFPRSFRMRKKKMLPDKFVELKISKTKKAELER